MKTPLLIDANNLTFSELIGMKRKVTKNPRQWRFQSHCGDRTVHYSGPKSKSQVSGERNGVVE